MVRKVAVVLEPALLSVTNFFSFLLMCQTSKASRVLKRTSLLHLSEERIMSPLLVINLGSFAYNQNANLATSGRRTIINISVVTWLTELKAFLKSDNSMTP